MRATRDSIADVWGAGAGDVYVDRHRCDRRGREGIEVARQVRVFAAVEGVRGPE